MGWSAGYYLWCWENPYPERAVERIEFIPRGARFIVAGVTTSDVDEHPFVRAPARPVRLVAKDGRNGVPGRDRVAGLGGRGHLAGKQRESRRVRRLARRCEADVRAHLLALLSRTRALLRMSAADEFRPHLGAAEEKKTTRAVPRYLPSLSGVNSAPGHVNSTWREGVAFRRLAARGAAFDGPGIAQR